MDLLARREHSRSELARKLSRHFNDRAELHAALDRLTEEGLQSDDRFAASFVRERMLRGQGPRRIASELIQRGVSAALVGHALQAVPAEACETWESLADQALFKRFGSQDLVGIDAEERVRRLRFLHQRGFHTEAYGPVYD